MSASMEPGPVPPSSGDRPLRSDSSSMGNDSTSVGPSLSRNRSFSEAMVASSTKSSETSVSRHDALGLQHRPGQRRPPLDVDRVVGLLVGGVDVKAHPGRPSGVPRS